MRAVDTLKAMRDTVQHSMRPLLTAFAIVLLAGPAQAALNVCNKTAHPVKVALARFDGAVWTSQGWWSFAPRQCEALVTGKLIARYFYLFATDGGAGGWVGSRSFCVANDDKFTIPGRDDCAARGFERKGFFAVDTGQAADYTQSISD